MPEYKKSDLPSGTITLRVPPILHKLWKDKARELGLTLNGYIVNGMREYLNPVIINSGVQYSEQVQEMKRLNIQMEDLKQKQKDLLKLDSMSKMDLAPLGKEAYTEMMEGKVQDPILRILKRSNIPLSTFNIADELNQDADIIFSILAYLEQTQSIRQTEDMKWIFEDKEK
ncbi:MAG: toxin-antitoxin system HicB family antitoxin [Promethearchaeota archaeon]